VKGFLIPGSTGDGWELTKAERRGVLTIALEQAGQLNTQVLIGALHPDTNAAVGLIREDMKWLQSRWDERDPVKALTKAHVCGFTICPPRGGELTQEQIRQSLVSILELNLPTAIYQLPQVTLNEIGPALAAELAQNYQNFILFKDTSGADTVAQSRKDLRGVFTTRGAEGDYAQWLKVAGGPYDGFVLSSANCFARELHEVIQYILAGQSEQARRLSQRLASVIKQVFEFATTVPDGNPFANGNKAIDHFFAYGPKAMTVLPPRLHAGSSLPPSLIKNTEEILLRGNLMPSRGYLG
jgi:dihydrodipicolinate synthase/N-acetylneuraminate lyase